MQALEEKLFITNEEQRQQCLKDGKVLAVKRKIEQLQCQMELIFLSVRKKAEIIQNEACNLYVNCVFATCDHYFWKICHMGSFMFSFFSVRSQLMIPQIIHYLQNCSLLLITTLTHNDGLIPHVSEV